MEYFMTHEITLTPIRMMEIVVATMWLINLACSIGRRMADKDLAKKSKAK